MKTAHDFSSCDVTEGLVISYDVRVKGVFPFTTLVVKDAEGKLKKLKLLISPKLIEQGEKYLFIMSKQSYFGYVLAKFHKIKGELVSQSKRVIGTVKNKINFSCFKITGYVSAIRCRKDGILVNLIREGLTLVIHLPLSMNVKVGKNKSFHINNSSIYLVV